ncbi:Acetylspermidine deacetylase; Deacetylases, including yeast histone deacetylase and acetoin utilization protein [hydrothermal vent metagenome]|uniref:Acetylspermidine deacetylase Deacetylases, including yeast histone deacetylase and acetoin utilization protein n=1 Tax=hydrothermal vent metagenome TaxID=652676 RepID=A0A3B0TYZ8_9ZZZZ
MTTLFVTQPKGKTHLTPKGHAECPERLDWVEQALTKPRFAPLKRKIAESGDLSLAEEVHDRSVLANLQAARPTEGIAQIDADTFMSPGSLDSAATALGAGLLALKEVFTGKADNAFCAIRPPGHHAERSRSMGFCLINTIAIVARQAQNLYGVERVAIVDFDVHHGNGTQDIFKGDKNIFYGSSHQMPLFPGTGALAEIGVGNIFNAPLPPESGSEEMHEAYQERILPALENFSPELILISAGFDAHQRDPLANLNWTNNDFAWLTGKLMDVAEQKCNNRIVSLLEGGYDMAGLAGGVVSHVAMLQDGTLL